MIDDITTSETSTIWLAMFWTGGGPYTLWQIIHAYDYINRATPTRDELESAINTLLSLKLIVQKDNAFSIPLKAGRAFDAYRKTKRRRKFDTVRMYFTRFDNPVKCKKVFSLSEKEYKAERRKYSKFMGS